MLGNLLDGAARGLLVPMHDCVLLPHSMSGPPLKGILLVGLGAALQPDCVSEGSV